MYFFFKFILLVLNESIEVVCVWLHVVCYSVAFVALVLNYVFLITVNTPNGTEKPHGEEKTPLLRHDSCGEDEPESQGTHNLLLVLNHWVCA